MNSTLIMLDRFASFIAFVGFLFVIAKFLTKRLSKQKSDSVMMKLHRPVGYLTVAAGFIHMICSTVYFASTPFRIYVFGTLSIISMILAIVMFHLNRRCPGKWLLWHRTFCVIALVTLVLHFK